MASSLESIRFEVLNDRMVCQYGLLWQVRGGTLGTSCYGDGSYLERIDEPIAYFETARSSSRRVL